MPQSNSNLQSYAKLPAAKNNSPKIFSPPHSIGSHRSHRSHRICTPGVKSHRGFTLLLNSEHSEYSEHSECSDMPHDLSANLCEI